MSKTNILFAVVAVAALVLSCVALGGRPASSDEQGIGVRLGALDHWVYGELWEFAEEREFNHLEYSKLMQIATVGWTTARLLREHNYIAADNMLKHSAYLIDDYTELKYGEGGH